MQIQIESGLKELYIVIHTNALNAEIEQLIGSLSSSDVPLAAMREDRIILLRPEELYMVRIEDGAVFLYTEKKTEIEKAIVRNRTAAWKRDDPDLENNACQYSLYRLCRSVVWRRSNAEAQKQRTRLCISNLFASF